MSQLYANRDRTRALAARKTHRCRRPAALLTALTLLASALTAMQPAVASTAEDTRAVQQVLSDYEAAWSRHDARAIASFYYEPAMRVTAAGPAVRETRLVQEAVFTGLLQKLAQRGYATSTVRHLEVHLLDVDTAIASGVVVRTRRDGSLLETVGSTYLLWRTSEGWKIFLSANHEPGSAAHFRPAK